MAFLQSPVGLLIVGMLAGVASGLFGIGGGLIMVPIFMHVLKMEAHVATATSLGVVVLPVALPAAIRLYQAGNINLRIALWVALGFALASPMGAKINLSVNEVALRRIFAVLLVYSAVQMWVKPPKNAPRPVVTPPPTEQAP